MVNGSQVEEMPTFRLYVKPSSGLRNPNTHVSYCNYNSVFNVGIVISLVNYLMQFTNIFFCFTTVCWNFKLPYAVFLFIQFFCFFFRLFFKHRVKIIFTISNSLFFTIHISFVLIIVFPTNLLYIFTVLRWKHSFLFSICLILLIFL